MKRLAIRSPEKRRPAASTIVMSANSCWNIANFRSGLIRELIGKNYRVVVVAPWDKHTNRVVDLGVQFIELSMDSSGASILSDMRLLVGYLRIFRHLKPTAYLGFTAKPNIYGSLAARMAGSRVINNISGLGTVFIKKSSLTPLVSQLYRLSLQKSFRVFFQNGQDLELFVSKGLVRRGQADLIPGSGVDLKRFKPSARKREPGPFRFLFVGRLLWDKGIGEYVEAARLIHRLKTDVSFQILGAVGVDNRTAVPLGMLEQWRREGTIEYLGETDDVRPALEQADCVVLPSYREGLPRALLEGSAMGKPLIATDVPGCRDVIVDGETGYLCEVRSWVALEEAMRKMLELSPCDRLDMGRRGRARIEGNYGESLVFAKYLEALGQE